MTKVEVRKVNNVATKHTQKRSKPRYVIYDKDFKLHGFANDMKSGRKIARKTAIDTLIQGILHRNVESRNPYTHIGKVVYRDVITKGYIPIWITLKPRELIGGGKIIFEDKAYILHKDGTLGQELVAVDHDGYDYVYDIKRKR